MADSITSSPTTGAAAIVADSSESPPRFTLPIVPPCHDAPLLILTTLEGRAYLQSEVPSEILCTAEGCYNSWSAKGEPDEYNRPPAQTTEAGADE